MYMYIYSYRIMGKFGEYYIFDAFERNWQILICRLRRGYYTTLTLNPPENFNLAVIIWQLIWRSTVKFTNRQI